MLPKTGPFLQDRLEVQCNTTTYAIVIATALHEELGETHRAVKTIQRWTGAGERTATKWLAAENGPSGPHLATLARHSDAVLEAFLIMAGRERALAGFTLTHVRAELMVAVERIDRLLGLEPISDGHH